jgi:hypothetical protein
MKRWNHARFEVFMVVKIHVMVFWVVTSCSDVVGPCCLHIHGEVLEFGSGHRYRTRNVRGGRVPFGSTAGSTGGYRVPQYTPSLDAP